MHTARLLTAVFLACAVGAQAQKPAWGDALEKAKKARSAEVPPPTGAAALPAVTAETPEAPSAAAPAASPVPKGPSEERAALDKLSAENALVREEVAKRLRSLIEEKEELKLRHEAQAERNKAEVAKIEAELQRLSLENRLLEERNKQALEELTSRHKRLAAENQLSDETHKKALAEVRQAKERLQQDNELLRERLRGEEIKNLAEKQALDLEMQRMSAESMRLKSEREKLEDKAARLRAELEARAKKEEWRSEANRDPELLKQPFKDGVLTVSDRRITLNGPIVRGVANEIIERISFYNNVSGDPIFLVIDSSPGGSVMEGHRIVKAIEASRAPVHVVVKGFAASMAAIITTLAPHSYAYPNAVILHHQPWGGSFGNPVQQKEQLEILKEWYVRLGSPVAKKMGLSLDQLTKRMYEKNSEGDWREFGDKAVGVKWVDDVVLEIRETGFVKKPEEGKRPSLLVQLGLEEKVDERGERFVRLPRLEPFDAYWIHNPDRYYR